MSSFNYFKLKAANTVLKAINKDKAQVVIFRSRFQEICSFKYLQPQVAKNLFKRQLVGKKR